MVGLEPSIGFLHESTAAQTKQSLVYDLQEPYRWLVDVSVITAFESGVLDLPDFYFTGADYSYRFDIGAKRRLIALLREQFNLGAMHNGRVMKWDTIIEHKAAELGGFLAGRRRAVDFYGPSPILETFSDLELRRRLRRIFSLSPEEADGVAIRKSTLQYLRRNTLTPKSLEASAPIRQRLEQVNVAQGEKQ